MESISHSIATADKLRTFLHDSVTNDGYRVRNEEQAQESKIARENVSQTERTLIWYVGFMQNSPGCISNE